MPTGFDAQLLKELLIVLGGVIWIALGVKQLFFKAPLPQPMAVSIEEELEDRFTSKLEHEALKASHEELKAGVDARLTAMSKSAIAGREKIYSKLDKIAEETAEQRSSLTHMTASLTRQEIKLDNLADKKADKK